MGLVVESCSSSSIGLGRRHALTRVFVLLGPSAVVCLLLMRGSSHDEVVVVLVVPLLIRSMVS